MQTIVAHKEYELIDCTVCAAFVEAEQLAEIFDEAIENCIPVSLLITYWNYGYDLETFEESYYGFAYSLEDFAQEIAEDSGLIAENATWPNNCIDWQQAGHELLISGDFFEIDSYYFHSM